MDFLKLILIVYLSILLINAALSFLCFYFYREKLYKLSLFLWLATFVNFLIQAIFTIRPLEMILGFSTYFVVAMLLMKILEQMINRAMPFRAYYIGMGVALLLTIAASSFQVPFWAQSLPTACGIALPMFHGAFTAFFATGKSKGAKIYGALLLVNAIHFMDYPFLLPYPAAALFGFSLALLIMVAMTYYLPILIIKKVDDRYTETLEQEVLKRTESLRASNSKLLEVTADNKYLLSVVCHDIATPMHLITHFGRSLKNDVLLLPNEADRTRADAALSKLNKASGYVIDMLTHVRHFHALREGKIKFERVPIELNQIVDEVRFLNEQKLQEKEITLKYENTVPPHVHILGDPSTLKNNIINNLITNAIKFSHPKSEIKLRAEMEGDAIKLSLVDHGVGIPTDLIPKLFETNRPTTEPGTLGERGSGFGLPIVKTSLNYFKASIEVTSHTQTLDRNHGTTFVMRFKKTTQTPEV